MDKKIIAATAILGVGVIAVLASKSNNVISVEEEPSPPGQPMVSDMNAISATTTTATFTWGAVSGATFYKLLINNLMVFNNLQSTFVTINDLTPELTYVVSVVACNNNGCSQPGPSLTVTMPTYSNPSSIPSSPGQPTASNVNAVNATTATATFTWGAVSGATFYKLVVNGATISNNIQTTSVTINNLVPGNSYAISVIACNSIGCSQPGPALLVVVPTYSTTPNERQDCINVGGVWNEETQTCTTKQSCEAAGYIWEGGACFLPSQINEIYRQSCLVMGGIWNGNECDLIGVTSCPTWPEHLIPLTLAVAAYADTDEAQYACCYHEIDTIKKFLHEFIDSNLIPHGVVYSALSGDFVFISKPGYSLTDFVFPPNQNNTDPNSILYMGKISDFFIAHNYNPRIKN